MKCIFFPKKKNNLFAKTMYFYTIFVLVSHNVYPTHTVTIVFGRANIVLYYTQFLVWFFIRKIKMNKPNHPLNLYDIHHQKNFNFTYQNHQMQNLYP